jgi:hypothetical protein
VTFARTCGSAVLALALLTPVPSGAQDLTLAIRDGRAKLSARNVTASRILAEWARVGRTRVVNAERLAGPLLTLELDWVPERVALETILRSASGYVAAPRPAGAAGGSLFDRILIMPASAQVAGRPVSMPPPTFPQPPPPSPEPDLVPETMSFDPPLTEGQEVDAYVPPEEVVSPGATGPGEISQPFAPGQDGDPVVPGGFGVVSTPSTGNPWNVPAGSSRPGVITPPSQPQEPNNPQPPPLEPQ